MTPREFDFDKRLTAIVEQYANPQFESEPPKLSRQCALILELFKRQTEVTNVEMAEIALKYTNRLSDLRAAGYEIRPVEKQLHGVRVYEWLNRPAVTR